MKQNFVELFYTLFILASASLINTFAAAPAFSASASSSVYQRVLSSTYIEKVSDFKFQPSNLKLSDAPNTSARALFSLRGLSDKTFTVSLSEKNVFLKNHANGRSLELKGLESFPAGTTKTNKAGQRNLVINVSKIPSLKKFNKNLYSGRLVVDVVY